MIIVCYRNLDQGVTSLDPPPAPVLIKGEKIEGPDGGGDFTVIVDVEDFYSG